VGYLFHSLSLSFSFAIEYWGIIIILWIPYFF
jgi:hypothetical protein